MQTSLLWFAALGPLVLAAVAAIPVRVAEPRHRARVVRDAAQAAAAIALVGAIAVAVAVAVHGPLTTGLVGHAGVGLSLALDALSASMLLLVSFIGLVVLRYARHYLDGDPGQPRFVARLCATLAAVLTLIIAGNLLPFAAAWIATSLGLHGLLVFYRERAAAVLAARKKWLASRAGDLCLALAVVLVYAAVGSLEHADIRAAAIQGELSLPLHVAAVLLALTALLKSAQFPLHGWLLDVMETPTPVSALLHAGIVNAGGFLVLRYADLVGASPFALHLLALVGGFTALVASVVMLTQTSIKVALAWSTVAQMGFMLLQCGLGAWSAALLHIVAHSLYKAHAFLSSGSVMDVQRAAWAPTPGGQPHPARIALALTLVLGTGGVAAALFGVTPVSKPGVFALGAVMALGLVHLVANAIDERPSTYVIGMTLARAAVVALAWLALQASAEHLTASALPATAPLTGALDAVIVLLVVLSFAALTLFQGWLPRVAESPRWQAWHTHVVNGFYVNTLSNRIVLALWPSAQLMAGTSQVAAQTFPTAGDRA